MRAKTVCTQVKDEGYLLIELRIDDGAELGHLLIVLRTDEGAELEDTRDDTSPLGQMVCGRGSENMQCDTR